MARLKAGAILLSAEWFSQISYDTTDDSSANIVDVVNDAAKSAVATLSKHFDVVHPQPIATQEDVKAALEDFHREQVDVFVVANLIYSGDDVLIDILKAMPQVPVILWSYNAYKKIPRILTMGEYFSVTGAPGMLQACAPMKRMGVKFGFVLGVPGDEKLDKELADYAKALEVQKRLKSLKIASIGRRYEPMSGAWIDELKLKLRLGPKMVWISAYEYAETVKALDEARVRAFVDGEVVKYPVEGVEDEDIVASAKASIATYDLAKKYGCEVMSVQDMDPEIHDFIGCRPQMTYQPMFDEGIQAGMEADIDSALCTWICYHLSEGPAMYGEILTYDEEENFLVVGHASMHDLRLAGDKEIKIIPDLEFQYADRYKGVWNEFISKPGEVTLVAMFEDNDHYKFVTCVGESLDKPVWVPGYGQALVHTDIPMRKFMKDITTCGVTQHFALCFGNIKNRVELLAERLNMEYVDLDRLNGLDK